jgi:hypothetical protein
MQLPTIHSNGTRKEALVEALCQASTRLDDAYHALRLTSPNGRDYYPQGPAAMEQALAEHWARMKALDKVMAEIDALTVAIDRID